MSTQYATECGIECSGNYYSSNVIGCKGCACSKCGSSFDEFMIQKNIQKQTGISSSTYLNNLVPFEVTKNQNFYKNQGLPNYSKVSSDRIKPSNLNNMNRVVNRNTSSLKGSKTSLKPGSLAPGGIGVDIKHNSYDRYLAKLKVKNLRPKESSFTDNVKQGNKKNNILVFNYSYSSKCVLSANLSICN